MNTLSGKNQSAKSDVEYAKTHPIGLAGLTLRLTLPFFPEGTTTETEKPVRKHKKVKVSDHTVKNPVSILNEMYKGLKYNFIQQKGPSNNPIFTVEVELNTEKYQSTGRSKSLAKHRVAKKILEILDPAKFCKDDTDSGFGSEGNGSIGGGESSQGQYLFVRTFKLCSVLWGFYICNLCWTLNNPTNSLPNTLFES